jgi:tRNA-splicing ligase RtcB
MEQIAKGLLSWASILEDQAREQALRTASLPWIRPHVALMPDAHWGMGSTVGSVIRPPTSSGIRRRQPGRDGGPGRRLSRRVVRLGHQR